MAASNNSKQMAAEISRASSSATNVGRTATATPLSAIRPALQQQNTSFNQAFDRSIDAMNEKAREHIAIDIHPVIEETPHFENGSDPLKTFHTALGIPAPKPVKVKPKRNVLGRKKKPEPHEKPPKQPKVSDANKGVYKNVLLNERWSRLVYQLCDALLTACMFLQIIVGAAVTAFGAGSANHTIITVFGATNTALASLLAVLKSKGLPNRLRQDWNGWRELREYIEEKEREIDMRMQGHGEGLPPLDIWATVRDIEGRYQTMRLTLEANRPDTYIRVPPPK